MCIRYVLISLLITLVGCSTDLSLETFRNNPVLEAQECLKQASLCEPDNIHCIHLNQLKAAEWYIQAQDIGEAQKVLKSIKGHQNDPYFRKGILNIRLALLKKDLLQAHILVKTLINKIEHTINPTSSTMPAQKIALLLPMSGQHSSSAKVIRDGFFAAYYLNRDEASQIALKVYDTKGHQVIEAYKEAMADGSQFIVGPLFKTEVEQIAKLAPKVPVIALNVVHTNNHDMYQFGLMPEDEARSTALFALKQGHRKALVIYPLNEWGQRIEKAFTMTFMNKGGHIIKTKPFRHNRDVNGILSDLLKTPNADMIFVIGNPSQARMINPIIQEYAEHLPTYTIASAYTGHPDPKLDSALNNMFFCDMPWILQNTHQLQELQHRVDKHWGESASRFPRFFAFGMDAYKLSSQLIQNPTFPYYGIPGITGDLTLDAHRHIDRTLLCTRFKQGIPVNP